MIDNKLTDMVLDLKCGETCNTFEEMLERIDKNNRLYNEIIKTSEKETIDKQMLFYEFRVWFVRNMELDILVYLKEVI